MAKHRRLSASSSPRWIPCPGSIAYIEHLKEEKKIPEDTKSDASIKGDKTHEIFEYCVDYRISPMDLSDAKVWDICRYKLSRSDLASVDLFWQFVFENIHIYDKTYAEQSYDLSYQYDADIGGTADLTQCQDSGTLHIGDYKNGRTLVEASTPQIKIYALGAFYEFDEIFNFQDVKLTIGQPNAYHTDGKIRSESLTVDELMKWEENTLIPVIEKIKSNTTELNPGEKQCEWCPAAGVCEANAKQTSQIIQLEFNKYAEPRQSLPSPQSLTGEQLAFILDNKNRVQNWLKEIDNYAKSLLEKGERIGKYQLSTKKGNRKLKPLAQLRKILRHKRLESAPFIKEDPQTKTISEVEHYLKTIRKWNEQKIKTFMDDITDRGKDSIQLLKSEHTTENDFTNLIEEKPTQKRKPRTNQTNRKKRN